MLVCIYNTIPSRWSIASRKDQFRKSVTNINVHLSIFFSLFFGPKKQFRNSCTIISFSMKWDLCTLINDNTLSELCGFDAAGGWSFTRRMSAYYYKVFFFLFLIICIYVRWLIFFSLFLTRVLIKSIIVVFTSATKSRLSGDSFKCWSYKLVQ